MADFGKGYNRGPREMHDATCSECGQPCQVPFKPTDGRPVYCRDCYSSKRPKRF
jgi:CxxC-x17-CxxC domain-containing protein